MGDGPANQPNQRMINQLSLPASPLFLVLPLLLSPGFILDQHIPDRNARLAVKALFSTAEVDSRFEVVPEIDSAEAEFDASHQRHAEGILYRSCRFGIAGGDPSLVESTPQVQVQAAPQDGIMALDQAGEQKFFPLQAGLGDAFDGDPFGESLLESEAPVGAQAHAQGRAVTLGPEGRR